MLRLLTQHAELAGLHRAALVAEHRNVVGAHRARRPDAHNTTCGQPVASNGSLQHVVGVLEELASLGACLRVIEDLGVAAVGVLAADLPHGEERVPVNERDQLRDGHLHWEHACSGTAERSRHSSTHAHGHTRRRMAKHDATPVLAGFTGGAVAKSMLNLRDRASGKDRKRRSNKDS